MRTSSRALRCATRLSRRNTPPEPSTLRIRPGAGYGFVLGQATDGGLGHQAAKQGSPPVVAYIRAGERPAIKRPPRASRAGGRAGRLNCARRLGRAYTEVVWQMLADAVRLGVIRHRRPEAWAAGAVVAGARGNGPSASGSRAVITRPNRGYAVRSIEAIAARPNGARPSTHQQTLRPGGRPDPEHGRGCAAQRSSGAHKLPNAHFRRTLAVPALRHPRSLTAAAHEDRATRNAP